MWSEMIQVSRNCRERKTSTKETLKVYIYFLSKMILVHGARSQASSTIEIVWKTQGFPLLCSSTTRGTITWDRRGGKPKGRSKELYSLATIPCSDYKISSQVLLQDNQARSSNKILQYSFFLVETMPFSSRSCVSKMASINPSRSIVSLIRIFAASPVVETRILVFFRNGYIMSTVASS